MSAKKRRSTSTVSLLLVPTLLVFSGCSYDPSEGEAQQRDVYTRFEDCVADWGKPELCQQIAQAEAQKFAQSTGVSGGGNSIIYWGPLYYGGERSVMHNGQTYRPVSNRAMSKPFNITSTSSNTAKLSPATPTRSVSTDSTARGGFGSTGRSVGIGSSGG